MIIYLQTSPRVCRNVKIDKVIYSSYKLTLFILCLLILTHCMYCLFLAIPVQKTIEDPQSSSQFSRSLPFASMTYQLSPL